MLNHRTPRKLAGTCGFSCSASGTGTVKIEALKEKVVDQFFFQTLNSKKELARELSFQLMAIY